MAYFRNKVKYWPNSRLMDPAKADKIMELTHPSWPVWTTSVGTNGIIRGLGDALITVFEYVRPADLNTPIELAQWFSENPEEALREMWANRDKIQFDKLYLKQVIADANLGVPAEQVVASWIHEYFRGMQARTLVQLKAWNAATFTDAKDAELAFRLGDLYDDLPSASLNWYMGEPWLSSRAMAWAEEAFARNFLIHLVPFGANIILDIPALIKGKITIKQFIRKIFHSAGFRLGTCFGAAVGVAAWSNRISEASRYRAPLMALVEMSGYYLGGYWGRVITGKLIAPPTPEKSPLVQEPVENEQEDTQEGDTTFVRRRDSTAPYDDEDDFLDEEYELDEYSSGRHRASIGIPPPSLRGSGRSATSRSPPARSPASRSPPSRSPPSRSPPSRSPPLSRSSTPPPIPVSRSPALDEDDEFSDEDDDGTLTTWLNAATTKPTVNGQ